MRQRSEQSKAYDEHDLALAEQVRVELWTSVECLAVGARRAGASWVRWIGEGGVQERED